MVLLHEAIVDKRFDLRVCDKNVVRGVISLSELEQQLKGLPDDSANAQWVNLDALAQLDAGGSKLRREPSMASGAGRMSGSDDDGERGL